MLLLAADDRGSERIQLKASLTEIGLAELVSDVERCLDALTFRSDVDQNRVFLLVLSEGCLIAMILANSHHLAGIALMAPPERPLDLIIKKQLTFISDKANYTPHQINFRLSKFQKFVKYTKENESKASEALAHILFVRPVYIFYFSAKWLRDHLAQPPSKIAPFVKCPVGIFFGHKDMQLNSAKDGNSLVKLLSGLGNDKVNFYLLKNVDHLVRIEPGISMPVRYYDTSRPIRQEFINCLKDWILSISNSNYSTR